MRAIRWIVVSFAVDRRTVFLFGVMTICCASLMGQASNNSPDGTPALFGTNADVNNSMGTGGTELGLVDEGKDEQPEKHKRGEFAVAPIPMVNPSIGNGGALVVMYATRLGGARRILPRRRRWDLQGLQRRREAGG